MTTLLISISVIVTVTSCGDSGTQAGSGDSGQEVTGQENVGQGGTPEQGGTTELSSVKVTEEVAFHYASQVQIYRLAGGYSLICVRDGRNYLLTPDSEETLSNMSSLAADDVLQDGVGGQEDIGAKAVRAVQNGDVSRVAEAVQYDGILSQAVGTIQEHGELASGEVPEGILIFGDGRASVTLQGEPLDCFVIRRPVYNIYMASSSTMSLFDAVGSLDHIRLSSLDSDGWYVENAKKAMEQGDIIYAGKYSEPDYELLLEEGCSLAVENTMLLHAPEVQEKLEELGITVWIDYSSYEAHPLGRTEWIKVYGELTGQEAEAEAFFAEQEAYVTSIAEYEDAGKTVAFFYMSESGSVVARKSGDYVPQMIGLAGGHYIFDSLGGGEESASSSVNMTMEEFYATAKDADYIIYNGTIDHPLTSVQDLVDKNALFQDFKAVKEGHVWCSGKNMFQATDVIGSMIYDIHTMLTDEEADELTFLYRVL